MNEFERLGAYITLERRQLDLSPWARSLSVADWLQELKQEIAEAEAELAMGKGLSIAAIDELADVLRDALHVVLAAEKAGATSFDEVISLMAMKILRRKPWLIDGSPIPQTREEEIEIWQRIKAAERKER